MFFNKGSDGLEFDNELSIDHKVSKELTQRAAVLVVNSDRHLLFDSEILFSEAVAKSVFVYFLIMAVSQERMGFEGRLANGVG